MKVIALDHLVLTVADIEATLRFYQVVLGMEPITFDEGRRALRFGKQKINLHSAGGEIEPKAGSPAPGSADLCFLIGGTVEAAMAHLARCGVALELGPVGRSGAQGGLRSLYIRDPDGNLIELGCRQGQ
jgi:catechol 2,3-dioxygenase-like lactoylglutathione lyase family enzyme